MQQNRDQNQNQEGERDTFIQDPFVPVQQPVPPPAPVRTGFAKWLPILLAFFMLLLGFGGGWLVRDLTRPKAGKVVDWMMQMIEEHSLFYTGKSEAEIEEIIARMGKYGVYYMTDAGSPEGDRYSDFFSPRELTELLNEMNGDSIGIAAEMWQDYDGDTPLALTRNIFVAQVYDTAATGPYSASNQLQLFDRFVSLEQDGKFVSYWEENYSDFYFEQDKLIRSGNPFRAQVVRVEEGADGSWDYPRTPTGEIDISDPVTVTLKGEDFNPSYVTYLDADSTDKVLGQDCRPMSGTGMDADTAYVALKSFNGQAAEQFGSAMRTFREKNKKKLILDLRYDGGGYMDILNNVAGYLVRDEEDTDKLLIGTHRDKKGKTTPYNVTYAKGQTLRRSNMGIEKVVVLVNRFTASASEALVGAMDFYNCLDAMIGTRTYGKGIMQSSYYFQPMRETTFAIKLTTAMLYWPDNSTTIHAKGFRFDDGPEEVLVPIKADNVYVKESLYSASDFSDDAQLMAAVAYLR